MLRIDPGPREVAAGFWVGGFEARLSPPPAGWSLIVNCTHESYAIDTPVIRCPIDDGDGWTVEQLDAVYRQVTQHLERQPGDLLVHCFAGVSRSVSMSVYLLTRMGLFMTPAAALNASRYSSNWFFSPKGGTIQSVLDALERL